ncbi:MAG TPA: TonB-dependent receptor, partial [Sphingomicrobium sp.]|nr:TonB-dependent receptor [Sphingomicrobium sp.]
MRFSSKVLRSLLLGSTAAAMAAPGWAQTQEEEQAQSANPTAETTVADPESSEEILVTATKRASRVQDVPFSINAQTQEDIQRANATTIEDISRNVAGLAVQNLGPGQSQVSIRGVSAGQIIRDQPGVKEQVGVYLDESVISLSLFNPDFDLFDLNRVETLRGPQGTLFGSGSVGGTLRYITNQPKLGVTEGVVEANVNTVDERDIGYHLKGAINIPIGETAAIRAVAYGTHYAGFIDAVGPAGGKNVNDGSRIGGRLSLLWEPTPDIKITPRIVYQEVRADGFNREEFYNLYDNQFTSTGGELIGKRKQYLQLREEFRDDTLLADLTASIAFGGVELTSISSYIDRDILVSRDASALTGSVGISPLVACCGVDPDIALLPSNLVDTTDLKQFTQEVRLASTGAGPFQWVVGGFYTDITRNYAQRLPTPGYDAFIDAALGAGTSAAVSNGFPLNSPYNADLPYDISQKAVFGEASYDFGQFKLTAGGRYYDFKETRDFVSGGLFSNGDNRIGDKTKSDGFSPRVIATWEPNRNLSVNLQAAKGFRLGGINDPLNLTLCTPADAAIYGPFQSEDYNDETLWNYEAGVKYSRGPITFNAAVFHTKIRDLQVTVDAGSCSSRIVLNVDKAHTTGVEAEFSARPIAGLELSLAGSYVDAEFDSTVNNATLASLTGIRKGNRLPSVPKFQMAATATYGSRFSSNADWYVSGSFQHIGSRITQPGDQEPFVGLRTNMIFYDPVTGANGANGVFDWTPFLKLPSYNLVNLSFGLEFDSGLDVILYANNLFDENAKLAFDRERGGRARLGYHVSTPRTIGLTLRQAFRAEAAAPP